MTSSRLMQHCSTSLQLLPLEDRIVPITQPFPAHYVAIGADAGSAAYVTIVDTDTNQIAATIEAYDPTMTAGVAVDLGDVTGDGVADIITTPGVGGAPHIRIFDGVTGGQLQAALGNFFAGDAAARLGADVTT